MGKEGRKVIKRYKLLVIRQISAGDIMYNMMTVTHCCMILGKLLVNPKCSHNKENFFSSFFSFYCIYMNDGC